MAIRKPVQLPLSVQRERKERIQEQLQFIPPSLRSRYKKVMSSGSKAMASRLRCIECSGWNVAEVRKCKAYTCPLWYAVVAPLVSKDFKRKKS